MTISVIIPTYNEEKVIKDCLKSLDKQTFKDFEEIVVDDGSTDKTLQVLSECQMLASRSGSNVKCQILKQNHKGPGEARNLGAKKAKGDILVFVDADMTFNKGFVKELVEPIITGKTKGTFSREEYVSNWDNIWAKCWNFNESWEDGKRHPKNYPNTQKVFRAILKKEFDRVGGFSIGGYYTDDWSLSEKLGYEATIVKDAKFYHENPDNLLEVFNQAKWVGKRPYKLGMFGSILALVRTSLMTSIVVGILKSIIHKELKFFIFKIIYDLGMFLGILEYILFGKGAK